MAAAAGGRPGGGGGGGDSGGGDGGDADDRGGGGGGGDLDLATTRSLSAAVQMVEAALAEAEVAEEIAAAVQREYVDSLLAVDRPGQ